MYQICICDDEQEGLLQLSEKIKVELERLALEADYTLIQDSRVLMEQLEQKNIDILFLDIDTNPLHLSARLVLMRIWQNFLQESEKSWSRKKVS